MIVRKMSLQTGISVVRAFLYYYAGFQQSDHAGHIKMRAKVVLSAGKTYDLCRRNAGYIFGSIAFIYVFMHIIVFKYPFHPVYMAVLRFYRHSCKAAEIVSMTAV